MTAAEPDPTPEATLRVAGTPVADHVTDVGWWEPTLAPRPHLHPVRTLAGVEVTEARPVDHPWHLGVFVAVQDVEDCNFWGGRTFVRGQGPTWRPDHGSVRHERWTHRDADALASEQSWISVAGETVISETRATRSLVGPPTTGGWVLDYAFTLRNVTGRYLDLGSPATNGKVGGGYGGFFWRAPLSSATPRVFTATAEGEEAVHTTRSGWLAFLGHHPNAEDLVRGDGPTGDYTLLFVPADERTAEDPWFVRVADYPGVGSSLAPEHPLRLPAGDSLRRRFRVLVLDGHLERGACADAARSVAELP
ncbi:PmoA family protein [Actinoalloteichus caeruleus]|uniref:DUF6807 domain-containing protein n=1 Tax=Actinoalloteichus cyanogriseus TaxID=2893586 RepID=UPI003AAEA855